MEYSFSGSNAERICIGQVTTMLIKHWVGVKLTMTKKQSKRVAVTYQCIVLYILKMPTNPVSNK